MFVRINDPSSINYRRDEVLKSILGIKNNLPHLVPFSGLSNRTKRTALRQKGLVAPSGMMLAEVPLVGVPAAIDGYVRRYARKLAAALYYKEKGKPIGLNFMIWIDWGAATDAVRMKGFLEIAAMSPFVTIGQRVNLDFGDRFGYRYDKADENELFTAVAQFGQGLVIAMLIADGGSAQEIEEEGWIKASAMFD
jgi:hypothetical protein